MLRNYLLIALRTLRRQWGYSVLNVVGLGVGMAACLLIGLYVHDELQVDRFHERSGDIVQFGFEAFWGKGLMTPYPLASTLTESVPGIERAVRVNHRPNWRIVREQANFEGEYSAVITEPDFFKVFTFPAVHGNPSAALSTPDGLVLTESLARTIFGDADPIGQTLRAGAGAEAVELVVRAVVRDVPASSTVQFEAVVPITLLPETQRQGDAWGMYAYFTYALLEPGVGAGTLADRLAEALAARFENEPPRSFVVPLTSVYLSDLHNPSGFRGQVRYLYIFGFAALFVLLIAGINYVNLSTAQGLRRAREIGVRKSVGAGRGQVARQFLSESLLLSGLALVAGLVLVVVALPTFNSLFDKSLELSAYAGTLALLAIFVLAVGILGGSYPALVLSRFDTVRVLRQQGGTGSGSGWLRKGLVVVQFAASSVLIMGTAVIYSQVQYMQTKDLGFDGEQLVSFDLHSSAAWETAETIRQEALRHPAVVQATISSAIPTAFNLSLGFTPAAISTATEVDPAVNISIRPARVDAHFVETMGLRLIAGRSFDADQPSDGRRAYVVNEATARALGWTSDEAIGKPFRMSFGDVEMGEIIGVVEDFHIGSLHGEIPPVGFQMFSSPNWSSGMKVVARLSPDDIPGAMSHLETSLKPFAMEGRLSYSFLDQLFGALYEAEIRLGRIFTTFALLAILIACLGLFGLAAHAVHARTREIGIRKALGASTRSILTLISAEFVKLVAVAFVVGAPLAYYLMSRWLEDFAYRIEIGGGVFLVAALLASAAAAAAVGYHAIRAASTDPVRAIRSE